MEPFVIPRLDSEYGVMRVAGHWDPIENEMELTELDQMGTDGWSDVSFWMTEQEFEHHIEVIKLAVREHLTT
ncbi:hypothetical protein [Veronia pacifica]|uniref:Uncharacterized protein n=1 Tax=Veronia pacifica TaxID=1080227 RepID=A0A1C3EC07_9GAMM|nr:hypothetical protein [Veronia pacifica]ODA30786.1 hypothetical protein A8L45_19235 [Veronia pacifica]